MKLIFYLIFSIDVPTEDFQKRMACIERHTANKAEQCEEYIFRRLVDSRLRTCCICERSTPNTRDEDVVDRRRLSPEIRNGVDRMSEVFVRRFPLDVRKSLEDMFSRYFSICCVTICMIYSKTTFSFPALL